MFMRADIVLEVDGVSKLYSRNALESQKRLGEVISSAFWGRDLGITSLQKKEFWALNDISFYLKRGEAIGVIGLNGAGKTTLLRLLNGQFPPDKGEVRLAGHSASMIDLTAGFNNRMSGLENIYLRSAILGKKREEVDEQIEEICKFTELDDALAAPLSTYSSGMRMRLAFATTVFVNPDLLIIDEVLAVGDFQFRQKCLEKIRQLREQCAFVFASHSMTDVVRFCNLAIVLDKGRISYKGSPEEAIRHFQKNRTISTVQNHKPDTGGADKNKLGEKFSSPDDICDVKSYWASADGKETDSFHWGEEAILRIEFAVRYNTESLNIGVPIWNIGDEQLVSALSTEQKGYKIVPGVNGRCQIDVAFNTTNLMPGTYESVTAIIDGPKFLYRQPNTHFTIKTGTAPPGWGRIYLPHEWTTSQQSTSQTEPTE